MLHGQVFVMKQIYEKKNTTSFSLMVLFSYLPLDRSYMYRFILCDVYNHEYFFFFFPIWCLGWDIIAYFYLFY